MEELADEMVLNANCNRGCVQTIIYENLIKLIISCFRVIGKDVSFPSNDSSNQKDGRISSCFEVCKKINPTGNLQIQLK